MAHKDAVKIWKLLQTVGAHRDGYTRTGGAVVQWCCGPVVPWSGGAADRWCRGPVVSRTGGAVDRWCCGPVVPWSGGAAGRWCRGPVVLRTGGAVDRWCCGPVVPRAGGDADRTAVSSRECAAPGLVTYSHNAVGSALVRWFFLPWSCCLECAPASDSKYTGTTYI